MTKESDKNTKVDSAFMERVAEVIERAGGEAAFASASGLSRSMVEKYKRGSEPSRSSLISMAQAAGVYIEWLATGNGEKSPTNETYVSIPVMASKASAGGGAAIFYDEIGDSFPMPRIWLERHNLKAKDLFVIYGVGESMDPVITNGEKLLCSSAEHHLRGDGVFIIRQDGDLMVKRLQRLPGKIRVLPANPAYQPYDVELSDGTDFKIIGRVLYKNIIQRVS